MSKSWWIGSRKSLFGEVGGDLCGSVACPGCDCGFGACDAVVFVEASFASLESDSFVSPSSAVSEASGPGEEVGPSVIGGEAGRLNNEELGIQKKKDQGIVSVDNSSWHCNGGRKESGRLTLGEVWNQTGSRSRWCWCFPLSLGCQSCTGRRQ